MRSISQTNYATPGSARRLAPNDAAVVDEPCIDRSVVRKIVEELRPLDVPVLASPAACG